LRGGPRRADCGDIGGPQTVGQTVNHGCLWPDYHERDLVRFAKRRHGAVIARIERDAFCILCDARISGGGV
jgi:hypothetical protein